MKIELFLAQQNIERYEKLLEIASDEVLRRQIMNLLHDEQDRLSKCLSGNFCSKHWMKISMGFPASVFPARRLIS